MNRNNIIIMETINQEFFHVHRVDPNISDWTTLKAQFCFHEYNYFYDRILRGRYGYEDDSGFLYTRQAIHKFIVNDKIYKDKYINEIINLCNATINELSITIREHTFESVRQKYFSNLPSRMKCIWLCTKKDVHKWWDIIKNTRRIYKLRLDKNGLIHKTNDSYLINDSISIMDYINNAKEYWSGSINPNTELIKINEEILYEGNIEIIGVYDSLEDFYK